MDNTAGNLHVAVAGDGYSKSYAAECVTLQNTSNLRHEISKSESEIRRDIAKAECDLKHMIGEQTNHMNLRFADMHNNIRDGKEEAMKANFETRLTVERLAKEQLIESIRQSDAIKLAIHKEGDDNRADISKLSRDLQDCCCEMKELALRERLANTKDELVECRLSELKSGIVAEILSKLVPIPTSGK